MEIRQTPAPDAFVIAYRGDTVTFELATDGRAAGSAWIRTNIGRGRIRNEEIIRNAEVGLPPLSQDWHDLPMRRKGAGRYTVTLPLLEVGRFEAKVYFTPNRPAEIVWPSGKNTVIKVEPAETAASNTMYTAFVRQFGPDKNKPHSAGENDDAVRALDAAGYEVIPKSGKFRDLISELDFITQKLRCRIIQLLPIFPTPTTYARMGRYGSPFAAMDLFDVDPALAVFDKQTTPLQQFHELADEIHRRDARLFLDLPINHTGWASSLQIHHPEWFVRNDDDTFMSPGAWGIVWGDLSELDYAHLGLWQYMAEVFLFWCRHGADGFRLDAGYKIPFRVWEYIVARVRNQYPDTVFMLEGLGGDPKVTERLLADAGINWAYSELFQNHTKDQLRYYLPEAQKISASKGTLIHFSETHDNNRLASVSHGFARLRTILCALASDNGAFGFAAGVEWFAEEKISVHGSSALNWGAETNMVDTIARLQAILEIHPSFHPGGRSELVEVGEGETLGLVRTDADGAHPLLLLVNLDMEQSHVVSWSNLPLEVAVDLLTDRKVLLKKADLQRETVLAPGQAAALTDDKKMAAAVLHALSSGPTYDRNRFQVLKAKALEIYRAVQGEDVLLPEDLDPTKMARDLSADPAAFCDGLADTPARRVTLWRWSKDARRTVMIPPDHFLYILSPDPFVAVVKKGDAVLRFERSMKRVDGVYFALVAPLRVPAAHKSLTLTMTVFEFSNVRHITAPLLLLSEAGGAKILCTVNIRGYDKVDRTAIATNELGSLAQVRRGFGEVRSKYDALLAGNLNERCPADRRVMLTRIRGWLICRGYSSALDIHSQKRFSITADGAVVWRFSVPGGQGLLVAVKIVLKMDPEKNRVTIDVHRLPEDRRPHRRADSVLAEIILRPDIEDRVCHDVTKAFCGPETVWPRQIETFADGFTFAPAPDRKLHLVVNKGSYTDEKEWKYQVRYKEEEERGMHTMGDVFSPGYFRIPLIGGKSATVLAEITTDDKRPRPAPIPQKIPQKRFLEFSVQDTALRAMSDFIVRRDEFKTVLAGFPWFLDWGRDTLIALRGIISAGRLDEARQILLQFAKFEQNGTLPNMIRGEDHSNRDTSDAPLLFFVAVSDLIEQMGNDAFLSEDAGERTVREVMLSIVNGYIKGTPNGIHLDEASGLIFSPSHFTWMDTNYPAGTPREGYPVEIQALWIFALKTAARLDKRSGFAARAKRAEQSLRRLFVIETTSERYLSDCLRGSPGTSAEHAVQDDAVRPNQLSAITLGAIQDKALCKSILTVCDELLVPGGIRSLADREVHCESPIWWNGALLNNPNHPYIGRYTGDEDTQRKPAYHNGTVWTWMFPSYCEAEVMTFGEIAKRPALALLSSASVPMNEGCLLHVPEIMDGDAPHAPKGCGAQAWGATEIYRVWKKIESY